MFLKDQIFTVAKVKIRKVRCVQKIDGGYNYKDKMWLIDIKNSGGGISFNATSVQGVHRGLRKYLYV